LSRKVCGSNNEKLLTPVTRPVAQQSRSFRAALRTLCGMLAKRREKKWRRGSCPLTSVCHAISTGAAKPSTRASGRVQCVGIRMDEPQMAALMAAHHRPGFYFRVLEKGEVGAGDEIVKVADGPEHMSVAEMDALLYLPGHTPEQLEARSAHSGLERAVAGFVSGDPATEDEWKPRVSEPRTRAAERSAACVAGSPTAESVTYRAGERQRGITDVDTCGWPPTRCCSARPVRYFAYATGAQRSSSVAQLFAFQSAQCEPLPGEYQAGGERGCQHLLARSSQGGPFARCGSAEGQFHAATGRQPSGVAQRGCWSNSGAGDAASLAAEISPREVWWLFGARNGEDHAFAEESCNLVKAPPGLFDWADDLPRLQCSFPLKSAPYAEAGNPTSRALVLFAQALGVPFAIRIKEFLSALLPRRSEFGHCNVPVRPAFLGNGP